MNMNRPDMSEDVKYKDYTKKVLAKGLESRYNGSGPSNQCRQVSD